MLIRFFAYHLDWSKGGFLRFKNCSLKSWFNINTHFTIHWIKWLFDFAWWIFRDIAARFILDKLWILGINLGSIRTWHYISWFYLRFHSTVVHVTIRVGTLGYDVVPPICNTCQKTSYGSYIVSQKGILLGICGLATIVNFTPKKHKIGKILQYS